MQKKIENYSTEHWHNTILDLHQAIT